MKISVVLRLLSSVFLFFSLGSLPYSFFQLLRWIVSGTSFYSGWLFSKSKNHNWAWFFFIVGVLFNPIVPFYLSRDTWMIIDIIVAFIFIISLKEKNIT